MINRKAENRRLIKEYGITLEEKETKSAEQSNRCKICGRLADKISLAVDHDHALKYCKIRSTNDRPIFKKWLAEVVEYPGIYAYGNTKKESRDRCKQLLKKKSIRGLLCSSCNRGLGKVRRFFQDKPEVFEAAAKYLREYQKELHGQK